MPLVTRGAKRPLGATVSSEEGRPLVLLHYVRDVVPLGATLIGDRFGGGADPGDPEPVLLDTRMDAALASLLRLRGVGDDELFASKLRDHCEAFPCGDLICQLHGLPIRHELTPGQAPSPWGCSAGDRIFVDHARRMIRSWNALTQVAHHATRRRTPLVWSVVEEVIAWPLLGEPDSVRKRLTAGGPSESEAVSVPAQKWLVAEYLRGLQASSGSRYAYNWLPQHGLRLTFEPDRVSDLGLYVASLVGTVLETVNVSGVSAFVPCQSCGERFQPRNSRQSFCPRPECQREHRRINKARQRAAKRPGCEV